MANEIFISYSRQDARIVGNVKKHLEAAGYGCWTDKGMDPGDSFKREIAAAIRECSLVIFFASKSSNASDWTAKEIGMAVSLKKKIVLVRLDDSEFNPEVAFDLVNLNHVDLKSCINGQEFLDRLIKTVKETISGKKSGPDVVPGSDALSAAPAPSVACPVCGSMQPAGSTECAVCGCPLSAAAGSADDNTPAAGASGNAAGGSPGGIMLGGGEDTYTAGGKVSVAPPSENLVLGGTGGAADIPAAPVSDEEPARRPRRKRRAMIVGALVLIILIVGGIAAGTLLGDRHRRHSYDDDDYSYNQESEDYDDADTAAVYEEEVVEVSDADRAYSEAEQEVQAMNSQCPMSVGNGLTMNSVYISGGDIVCSYSVDESVADLDLAEQNWNNNYSQTVTNIRNDGTIPGILNYCRNYGHDMVYEYEGDTSGRTLRLVVYGSDL